jgi:hypothetical protein
MISTVPDILTTELLEYGRGASNDQIRTETEQTANTPQQ